MGPTTQDNQPLALATAAWKDTLLLTGVSGHEGMSQLYQFEFQFVAENARLKSPLPFDKLLGEPLVARLSQGAETRYFAGVCAEFGQGPSDDTFTAFRAVVVPKLWLLTRRAQSRIFQHQTVGQILEKVLAGLDFDLKLTGKYEPRDYCVQYRETDFAFASRLMEEEGIFYYFVHSKDGHKLAVRDDPAAKSAPALGRPATLATAVPEAQRAALGAAVVTGWSKRQELRAGKVTLWDHTFELPHDHLASSTPSQESAKVGKTDHKLAFAANKGLEVYDWPGEYAQRFDGVGPGGGDRPEDPKKAREDGKRTAKLRMEQEAAGAVSVAGAGEWAQFVPGSVVTVKTLPGDPRAPFAMADGAYLITAVTHFAANAGYRSAQAGPAGYHNQFALSPADLPFRPPRATPRPFVQGTQTAVVVGPPGEEIFTDKYGRVKVQFHWDRDGKKDADSSCWVRVATPWAGRGWGGVHVPRVGHEVVVDFLEGDPDQPIVIGGVYNPDQMPPYKLPDHKTRSGLKSNSTPGGKGFNEVRFEDKAGQEQIFIHAQKNQDVRVRNDSIEKVGHDRHSRYGFYIPPADDEGPPPQEKKHGNLYEEVAVDHHVKVHKDKVEHVGGDVRLLIGGIDGDGNLDVHVKKQRTEKVDAGADLTVGKDLREKVGGSVSVSVGKDYQEKTGMKHAVDAGKEIHLKAGMNVVIEAGMQLTLQGPGGFITIGPTGVAIQGTMVLINSGGAAGAGSGASPAEPKDPKDAEPKKPNDADTAVTGKKSN